MVDGGRLDRGVPAICNAYAVEQVHRLGVPLRCVLVDDNADFLGSARHLLEADGLEVVGLATTGAEALDSAAELHPDVVLVDLNLGAESGVEVASQLLDADASMAVILISSYAEADLRELAATSRATGWLWKGELSASAIHSLVGHPPPDLATQ